ncbi:MAG: hypothetical protein L6W00_18130 [Lentisphaeria bacterium]|nr:MAG: hypothetical protein L6W00_18130 [Lentisphaeria bacterium]
MRSDDVKGRSYAPKGKTPVQYVKAAPEKIEYDQHRHESRIDAFYVLS